MGGVFKSWVVCSSRRWCLQVVVGVYKLWVVFTSRVQVVGSVWRS